MPECIELLPCDWLISNLCYQAGVPNKVARECMFVYIYIYIQGRTLPLGKGRRLPWAPESQVPPKMLFIYEMRINRGHANGCLLLTGVYYHDNRVVRVERASCESCLLQMKIFCI